MDPFAAVRRWADGFFGHKRPPPSTPPARRSRPARPAAEIEGEISELQQKLEGIESSLSREREFAKQTGQHDNQGLVDILHRRAKRVRAKINALASEIGAPRQTPPEPVTWEPRKRRACTVTQARGTDRSLAQAARAALKRGRFASASEQAIFKKLASDLTEGSPEIHLHVLERLGEIKSLAGLPILRAAVAHQSEEVRIAALHGALAMRHPATRGLLLDALGDSSHRVRVWAVRGLYGLDAPDLGELLSAQLDDPHPQVRRAALTYLSWKRIGAAERRVIQCLRDEAAGVRAAAAHALAHCGSDGAVFRLVSALGDDQLEVRQAAAEALKQILGAAPEVDVEQEDREARTKQVTELRAWWKAERAERLVGDKTVEEAETASEMEEEEVVEEVEEIEETEEGLEEAGLETEDGGLDDASPDIGGLGDVEPEV